MFRGIEGIAQPIAYFTFQPVIVGLLEFHRGNFPLFGVYQFRQAADRRADLLDLAVGKFNGIDHRFFGDLARPGLNHDNAFGRTYNSDIQLAFFNLFVGGIDDELAVKLAHPYRTDEMRKWDIRNHQSRSGAVDGQHVRIVFSVSRKHNGDDLSIVAESFREKRADGAVDHAAGQNFALAGTAFTLDGTARNESPSIGLFAV